MDDRSLPEGGGGGQSGGAGDAGLASPGRGHPATKPAAAKDASPSLVGLTVKNRWRLEQKIGQGAFGETYLGLDQSGAKDALTARVAIKLEKINSKKQVLKLEVMVLKKLQEASCVCRFVHCGRTTEYNYFVMELLGENLSDLRRKRKEGRFSLPTALRLSLHMLESLRQMHALGYLHRDVKPSNFAMGIGSNRDKCFVLDFGLARKYRLPSGQVRPPRDSAGFRGTARYASIHSHQCIELGRRDDLWSLFYVMIEFITGALPWRKLKDKDEIGAMKMKLHSVALVRDLPVEFKDVYSHLERLQFADEPDYNLIATLLEQALKKAIAAGAPAVPLYDWQADGSDRVEYVAAPADADHPPEALLSPGSPPPVSDGSDKAPAGRPQSLELAEPLAHDDGADSGRRSDGGASSSRPMANAGVLHRNSGAASGTEGDGADTAMLPRPPSSPKRTFANRLRSLHKRRHAPKVASGGGSGRGGGGGSDAGDGEGGPGAARAPAEADGGKLSKPSSRSRSITPAVVDPVVKTSEDNKENENENEAEVPPLDLAAHTPAPVSPAGGDTTQAIGEPTTLHTDVSSLPASVLAHSFSQQGSGSNLRNEAVASPLVAPVGLSTPLRSGDVLPVTPGGGTPTMARAVPIPLLHFGGGDGRGGYASVDRTEDSVARRRNSAPSTPLAVPPGEGHVRADAVSEGWSPRRRALSFGGGPGDFQAVPNDDADDLRDVLSPSEISVRGRSQSDQRGSGPLPRPDAAAAPSAAPVLPASDDDEPTVEGVEMAAPSGVLTVTMEPIAEVEEATAVASHKSKCCLIL